MLGIFLFYDYWFFGIDFQYGVGIERLVVREVYGGVGLRILDIDLDLGGGF